MGICTWAAGESSERKGEGLVSAEWTVRPWTALLAAVALASCVHAQEFLLYFSAA